MKLSSYEVDMHLGFINRPSLKVRVTEAPKREDLRYKVVPVEDGHTVYWAELDGLVSFYISNLKNQSGYGGQVFTLPLESGDIAKVRGPWSSRDGVMHLLGLPHSIEAQVWDEEADTLIGNHISLDWALEQGIPVGGVLRSGEIVYEPLSPDGELLKPLRGGDVLVSGWSAK